MEIKADFDATSEDDEEYCHEQFLSSLTEQEMYDHEQNIKRVKVDSPFYSETGGCFTKTSSSSITQQPDGSTLIEEWKGLFAIMSVVIPYNLRCFIIH